LRTTIRQAQQAPALAFVPAKLGLPVQIGIVVVVTP